MKLELLTNATVVNDAIRFVPDRLKEKLESSSSDSCEKNTSQKSVIMMKTKIS